jgi:outer membrane protein OmpA-like peptidoglycan-associated protein
VSRAARPFLAVLAALIVVYAEPAPRIPLREGLTIVTALNQPERGDYESIKTIIRADDKDVRLKYEAEAPAADGDKDAFAAILGGGSRKPRPKTSATASVQHVSVTRTVSRRDLKDAHEYRWVYNNGAPETYAGSTALGVSTAMLSELKTKGRTDIKTPAGGAIGALSNVIGGLLGGAAAPGDAGLLSGTLTRVESGTVPFAVLVNDELEQLAAVHARGRPGDDDAEFWILDEAENPLALKWTLGESKLQVIKLTFPREGPAETTTGASGAGKIERDLATGGRAVVYGIYFDFASDRIKEESEPVLREIAAVMTKNPLWKLSVEGHTDNIGGVAANLDLSRRRAASVRQALTTRYRVAGERLQPDGFGASRPKATNETIDGRARNRRVELVKQ